MPRWITAPCRKGEVTVLSDEQLGNEFADPEFAKRLQRRIDSDVEAQRYGIVHSHDYVICHG